MLTVFNAGTRQKNDIIQFDTGANHYILLNHADSTDPGVPRNLQRLSEETLRSVQAGGNPFGVTVHIAQINPGTGPDIICPHPARFLSGLYPEWRHMGFSGRQSFQKLRLINGRTGIAHPLMHTGRLHVVVDTKQIPVCIHTHTALMRSILHRKGHHVPGTMMLLHQSIPVDVRQNIPVDQQAGSLHEEVPGIGNGSPGSQQFFFIKKQGVRQIRRQLLSPFLKELRLVVQVHCKILNRQGCLHRIQQTFNQRNSCQREQRLWECSGHRPQPGSQPG